MVKTFNQYLAEAAASIYVKQLCELLMKNNNNPENPDHRTHPMREILDIYITFLAENIESKDEVVKTEDHKQLARVIIESAKPGLHKFYNNDYFNIYTLLEIIKKDDRKSDGEKVFLHFLKSSILKMLDSDKNAPENNNEPSSIEEMANKYTESVIKLTHLYLNPEVDKQSAELNVESNSKSIETSEIKPIESPMTESISFDEKPSPDKSITQPPVPNSGVLPISELDTKKLYNTTLDLAIDILSETSNLTNTVSVQDYSISPNKLDTKTIYQILVDLSIDMLISSNNQKNISVVVGGASPDITIPHIDISTVPVISGGKSQIDAIPGLRTNSGFGSLSGKSQEERVQKFRSMKDATYNIEKQMKQNSDNMKEEINKAQEDAQNKITNSFTNNLPPGISDIAGTFGGNPLEKAQSDIIEKIKDSFGTENEMTYHEIHSELFELLTNAIQSHLLGDEGEESVLRTTETFMNRHVNDFIEGENTTLMALIIILKESSKIQDFLKDILYMEFLTFLSNPMHSNISQWPIFSEGIAKNTIIKLQQKLQDYVNTNNPLEELYIRMKQSGFTTKLIDIKKQFDNNKRHLGLNEANTPAPQPSNQNGGFTNMNTKRFHKTLKTYSNSAFRNIHYIDSANILQKMNTTKKYRRHN
jgi:hypothetical protein